MNKFKLIAAAVAITGCVGFCKVKQDKVLDFARNHTPFYGNCRKVAGAEAEKLGIKAWEQQDAFIHAFTSAELAYKTTPKIAEYLGVLNETARLKNPTKDKLMDLYNNKKGIEIGKMLKKRGISLDHLPQIIKDSLDKGSFIVDSTKVKINSMTRLLGKNL